METYRNTKVVGEHAAVGVKRRGGVGAIGKSTGGDGGRVRKGFKSVVRLAVVVRKVKKVVDDERVRVTGDEEELRGKLLLLLLFHWCKKIEGY